MDVTLSPGVYVKEVPSGNAPIAGVGTSTAAFVGVVPDSITMPDNSQLTVPALAGEIVLVTNFTEFKNKFGDFSLDPGQRTLAHAVFGFLHNGGTRCYVMRVPAVADITPSLLETLSPIDEIAIVAAPVPASTTAPEYHNLYTVLESYCSDPTVQNRFAILDSQETYASLGSLAADGADLPPRSNYAAFYFPWIQVFDPGTKQPVYVPPCGHVAGVYARVDAQRGVHKAPANETIAGALDLKYAISKAQQDGLNPQGVNCIRRLNGNIRIWGARTVVANQAPDEFMYVTARRLFLYLRSSIDRGLQWAVFEPNNPELWAKITRNVSVFLEQVWRSGALFGATPQEAFFVKCDAETNPPAVRDAGQVVTEIGVALTRPAEFVVFHIGQKIQET